MMRRITLMAVIIAMGLVAAAQPPGGFSMHPVGAFGHTNDRPIDVVPRPDGGFYLGIKDVDFVDSTSYGMDWVYVVGANADGTAEWTTQLDTGNMRVYDGALTKDNGSVWAGHTSRLPTNSDARAQLTRLDSMGNLVWRWTDTALVDKSQFSHVLASSDGGFVGAGKFEFGTTAKTYLVKLNANGHEVWRWASTQTRESTEALSEITVLELADSTLLTTGLEDLPGGWDSIMLFRLQADGSLMSTKGIEGVFGTYEASRTLLPMPDGRIIMASNKAEVPSPIFPSLRLHQYVLHELDAFGNLLRVVDIDPLTYGEQASIASSDNGSIYISTINDYVIQDSFQYPGLIKVGSDLELDWVRELRWLSAQWGDSNLVSSHLAVHEDKVYQSQHLWYNGAGVVEWDTSGTFDFAGIAGRVYVDENENSVFDVGERTFSNARLSVNGTSVAVFDDGQYAYSNPRTDTLFVVLDTIPYHVYGLPSTGVQTVLPDPGQLDTTVDFIMLPNYGIHDAWVDLTVSPGLAGLQGVYTVDVKNLGTEPLYDATASLFLDTLLSLDSISSSTYSTTGSRMDWPVPELLPGDAHRTTVVFDIAFTGSLSPIGIFDSIRIQLDSLDENPTNNVDAACWDIGVPYDPNDKQVSWSSAPQQYTHDLQEYGYSPDSLDYLIRFQNMGSAPAVNVVVHDTLDAGWLDLSSFRLLASSHPVTIEYLPPNIAVFRHEGIFLPDTSEGWLESQGWVKFRIGLHSPLGEGDRLDNRGAIYFDFNPPIVTNTASIQWSVPQDSTASGLETALNQELTLFPNPNNGSTVQFCLNRSIDGILAYRITDLAGKAVLTSNAPAQDGCGQLRIQGLAPGAYHVILESQDNTWAQRLIVQP